MRAGACPGISPASAKRLVRRRQWPRQAGNDGWTVVLVPLAETRKPQAAHRHKLSPPDNALVGGARQRACRGGIRGGRSPVTPTTIVSAPDAARLLGQALTTLREQLDAANWRSDDDRTRADQAEAKVAALQAEPAARRRGRRRQCRQGS